MNKQDRKYVEDIAKQMGQMPETFDASVVMKLWGLIDDLDKQLTEIVEEGEFIDELVQLADKDDKPDDDYWLMDCGGGKLSEVEIGQIRRLAKAMKGAGEDKT